jgi:NTP pyrophosphatase (non-canonical NTP hydrolase)
MNFQQLQEEQKDWVKYNFGNRPSWHPLLGVMEELGELAHAHLKNEQGIRINENHFENKKDAIGDIVIYLVDYCTAERIDFQEVVEKTWDMVKKRDWKNNNKTEKNE